MARRVDNLEDFDSSRQLLGLTGQLFKGGSPCLFIKRITDAMPEDATRLKDFELFF